MEEKKQKNKEDRLVFTFTRDELKNPNIKRALASLLVVKFNFYRVKPFYEVSEVEVEGLKTMPLFTPVEKYGDKKYKNEIGKYKGKPVVKI